MSYNVIKAEGAQLFAEALKINSSLTYVKYAAARPSFLILPNLASGQRGVLEHNFGELLGPVSSDAIRADAAMHGRARGCQRLLTLSKSGR